MENRVGAHIVKCLDGMFGCVLVGIWEFYLFSDI